MGLLDRLKFKGSSKPMDEDLCREVTNKGFKIIEDPNLPEDEIRLKPAPKPIILKNDEILLDEHEDE